MIFFFSTALLSRIALSLLDTSPVYFSHHRLVVVVDDDDDACDYLVVVLVVVEDLGPASSYVCSCVVVRTVQLQRSGLDRWWCFSPIYIYIYVEGD